MSVRTSSEIIGRNDWLRIKRLKTFLWTSIYVCSNIDFAISDSNFLAVDLWNTLCQNALWKWTGEMQIQKIISKEFLDSHYTFFFHRQKKYIYLWKRCTKIKRTKGTTITATRAPHKEGKAPIKTKRTTGKKRPNLATRTLLNLKNQPTENRENPKPNLSKK